MKKFLGAINQRPEIAMAYTFFNARTPSYQVDVDKEKAKNQDWIQFNVNEFGLDVGNQRFRFDTKDIEHCPEMHLAVTQN